MSRWLAGLRVALRSIVRRRRVDDELDEEMQYHLDREIEEHVNTGLTPKEARYAALRAMGAIDKSKEESRDLRGARAVGDVLGDLRYAVRALRRSPGFSVLAVLVMALGIGANTAVFSVVNAVLLQPLPYADSERIVMLATDWGRRPYDQVTIADYRDWRAQSASFEAMATFRATELPVTSGSAAEYARAAIVDTDFFRVFGVTPIIGRTFMPDDIVEGSTTAPVLISHAYWQGRFGSDPDVLQRTVGVRNNPWPIVGVLPPGFGYPDERDLWVPQTTRSTSRTGRNFLAVGKIKPGVSIEQARAELRTIAARLEQQYPESNKGRSVAVTRLQDQVVGDVRSTLYLLWGVVGVVLLIACANTATLLLGKAMARTREVAIRSALGASRWRVVRQLMTESLVLACLAGVAGMLLAFWAAKVLVALAPFDAVRLAGSGIDRGVLAFTLGVSVATSLLFGLVPALHASKIDLNDALKAEARGTTTGRALRTRGVLVVAEIALAVVLLTGAGLLIKSLVALHNVELGFQPENVLVMRATGVRDIRENNEFFTRVLARVAALPGVVAAGATSSPPGDLSNSGSGSYFIDRRPEQRDRTIEPQTLFTIVAPGAFTALGIPLTSGRDFTDADIFDRPMVAIVNEALVRQSLAGSNPIGRSIFCNFDSEAPMTIVGVVGDVRQVNPGTAPQPECYMPYRQHNYNGATLNVVIRTVDNPTALAGTVRRTAAEIAPDVPVSFTTMEATMARRVETPTFRALLFGVLAALAASLAMAGVYGVMAFAVEQRRREIGLRMALGASKGSVLRLVLRQGLVLAAAGLAMGLAASVAAARVLTTMLFEVEPVDPEVYVGVVILLWAVTLLAGYVPARRAAIVNPAKVLTAN